MLTIQRRRGKSLHLELPDGLATDRPAIAALFLIRFDVKAGYTIAWKKSLPDVVLSDSVEFKSLPSGLHNVKEDLIYFRHDDYAGISAFVNKSTDKWERNALMLAVGALVPLENGRLGKSWKHADKLKELAEQLVLDPAKTQPLEDYWTAHHGEDSDNGDDSRPTSSSQGSGDKSKARVASLALDTASLGLSSYHPVLTLPASIAMFGPLLFPLYKAALLRKRILLMHQAPVQLACNFVYNISILSNIPSSVADLIPLEPLPTRLEPLFSVGIHDIDELAHKGLPESVSLDPGYGWIACSTDDVLATKTDVYDVLITIPPPHTTQAKQKIWPQIRTSSGQELKASQRDLRRYRTLRQSIKQYFPKHDKTRQADEQSKNIVVADTETEDESTSSIPDKPGTDVFDDSVSSHEESLIEPTSWSALAYNSFMWWASAGEKTGGLEDEAEHDTSLFRDFSWSYAETPLPLQSSARRRSSAALSAPGLAPRTDGSVGAPEMAIIAFFQRLTANIFTVVAAAVENTDAGVDGEVVERYQDGEDSNETAVIMDEDEPQRPVYIGSDELQRMGLDVWSDADKKFVTELVELYWGRKADVQGGTIDCCGVRIL